MPGIDVGAVFDAVRIVAGNASGGCRKFGGFEGLVGIAIPEFLGEIQGRFCLFGIEFG